MTGARAALTLVTSASATGDLFPTTLHLACRCRLVPSLVGRPHDNSAWRHSPHFAIHGSALGLTTLLRHPNNRLLRRILSNLCSTSPNLAPAFRETSLSTLAIPGDQMHADLIGADHIHEPLFARSELARYHHPRACAARARVSSCALRHSVSRGVFIACLRSDLAQQAALRHAYGSVGGQIGVQRFHSPFPISFTAWLVP
jgi:hypothetical protein